MKTYHATELFTPEGNLVTDDIGLLAKLIVETEVKTIASDHESKLMRIEIGFAIRAIAAMRQTTLTEAILDMNLCQTTHRAEKTFLKYARIAGSETLMKMAENPQISLSVLDEIAAAKKPIIAGERALFMKRVSEEVNDICKENLKDEGHEEGGPGRLVVLGATRNQAVGVIRRIQIEMGVKTKAGNGNGPEVPKEKDIQSKMLQLLNLLRIMFLPDNVKHEWLAENGLLLADVGATMISLQNDLVEAGIITKNANELKPEAIKGLKKLVAAEAGPV